MKIELKCEYCGGLFLREESRITRDNKRGTPHIVCSKSCSHAIQRKRIAVQCTNCKDLILRKPSTLKSSKVFCSMSCRSTWYDTKRCGEQHPNYTTGKSSYRRKAMTHYGPACTVCGYSVECVLQVHHRDGNRLNNAIDNLDVLCPTHHIEFECGIRSYKPEQRTNLPVG
jgi:hypothetical protein